MYRTGCREKEGHDGRGQSRKPLSQNLRALDMVQFNGLSNEYAEANMLEKFVTRDVSHSVILELKFSAPGTYLLLSLLP